ncbi:MAG TPA: hypothetical protein VGL53_09580 [Bryobacteraceae bacterium]|jgi:hypothetical protein
MSTHLTKTSPFHEIDSKDTLLLLTGTAFVIFGAGLILSTPTMRKFIGEAGIGNLVGAALPDFERYLKLQSK